MSCLRRGQEQLREACMHETTFISPTSPKNDGIAFGFKRFQFLNMFGANLEIWYFFSHFEAVFPLAPTASPMCGANGQK